MKYCHTLYSVPSSVSQGLYLRTWRSREILCPVYILRAKKHKVAYYVFGIEVVVEVVVTGQSKEIAKYGVSPVVQRICTSVHNALSTHTPCLNSTSRLSVGSNFVSRPPTLIMDC